MKTDYYPEGSTLSHGTHGMPPGADPSLYPGGFGENAYFRTWELQRTGNSQGSGYSVSSQQHHTPPSYTQAVEAGPHQDRYSEHIYESPKSIRRDRSNCTGGDSLQYFELDPKAMDKNIGMEG